MHIPYIQKVFKDAGQDFTLIPIMVGQLDKEKLPTYAKVLLPLFNDERTLFIVSSDFCHWGQRFQFTFKYADEPVIHKSIEKLDKLGMGLIENQKSIPFINYLTETRNTICGREPITLLMAIMEAAKKEGSDFETKFVKYA